MTATSRLRSLYVTWAFCECLLFGGLSAGWGSFVFILKRDGVFSDLCVSADDVKVDNITDDGDMEEVDCRGQNQRLALCLAVGSFLYCVGSAVMGRINFRFGTRVTRLSAMVSFVTGCLLTGFTSKGNRQFDIDTDLPWLIIPGIGLLGVGGILLMATNTQFSVLFSTRGASVMGILSGAFNTSGGLVPLVVKVLHGRGVSLWCSMMGLGAIHLLTMVSTFCFLPAKFITIETPEETILVTVKRPVGHEGAQTYKDRDPELTHYSEKDSSDVDTLKSPSGSNVSTAASSDCPAEHPSPQTESSSVSNTELNSVMELNASHRESNVPQTESCALGEELEIDCTQTESSSSRRQPDASTTESSNGKTESRHSERSNCCNTGMYPGVFETDNNNTFVNSQVSSTDFDSSKTNVHIFKASEKKNILRPTLRSCLISPTYLLHLMWFCVLQLRFYYFLGALNKWLHDTLPTTSEVSEMTDVLQYVSMCSLFLSPVVGAVYDMCRRRFSANVCKLRHDVMPAVLPLTLTCFLGMLLSALALFRGNVILYASFITVTIFRAFIYGMATAFLITIFPYEYFGALYGVMVITGGVVGLLQYGFYSWAEASGYAVVNGSLMALMAVSLMHPLYQWQTSRSAAQNKLPGQPPNLP